MQGGRGVLVSTDDEAYRIYIEKRRAMETKHNEVAQLQGEINTLKDEMSDIKTLLKQLISQGIK